MRPVVNWRWQKWYLVQGISFMSCPNLSKDPSFVVVGGVSQ